MDSFTQQSIDVLDYVADYSAFLSGISDTLVSAVVTCDTGLTINSTFINTALGYVRIWVSGGASGATYEVKCIATTAGGRQKTWNFKVKVKDL